MWAVLLVPILTVAMIRQRVSRDYLEGALIAYLAPIAYGLGLWIFLNWLDPGERVLLADAADAGRSPAACRQHDRVDRDRLGPGRRSCARWSTSTGGSSRRR